MSLCKTWQLSQRTFASQQGCSHILLLRWPNKTNKQTFCWLWVCEGRGNCHKGICIKTATLTNPSHKVSKQNKQSFCPPPLRIFLPFYGPVMYLLIVSLWKTWQLSRRTFASQQVCSLILLITKQTNNPPRIFLPSYTPVMYLLIVNLWKTWQLSRRTLASPFMKPLHFLFNLFYCLPAQTKQTKFCPPPRIFLPSYSPVMYLLIVSLWKTWQLSRRTFASRFMEPLHFLFNLFCCLPHTIQPRCNTDKPNKTWRRKRECMQPLSQCNVSKKNLKLFLDHE